MKKLIRLAEVSRRTLLSQREIYRGMEQGWFPLSVKLSPRKIAWVEEEIDSYVERMVATRRVERV